MYEIILELIIYNIFMKDFLKKLKYMILSAQERRLTKKLQPHLEKSFTNKTSKTILSGSETVVLNSETEKKIKQTEQFVTDIAKTCRNNPQKLLDYIRAKGTKIYRIKNAYKILEKVGEEEGLITELEGFKAFYINLHIRKKFSLHTEPMFIMSIGEIEYYYMLREFYKWYALQIGLPGFNFTAQEHFKIYLKNINDKTFNSMNYRDMLELKEAIARDKEANAFVINLLKEKDGSENIFKKLNRGGGTI